MCYSLTAQTTSDWIMRFLPVLVQIRAMKERRKTPVIPIRKENYRWKRKVTILRDAEWVPKNRTRAEKKVFGDWKWKQWAMYIISTHERNASLLYLNYPIISLAKVHFNPLLRFCFLHDDLEAGYRSASSGYKRKNRGWLTLLLLHLGLACIGHNGNYSDSIPIQKKSGAPF